jgi:hypothetical protein
MPIKYPAACTTEASRLSFCKALRKKLATWLGTQCQGMTSEQARTFKRAHFYLKSSTLSKEFNAQVDIARQGVYWNPTEAAHFPAGKVIYPSGLNQANEGSRIAFLLGLEKKLSHKSLSELTDLKDKLHQAWQDAKDGTTWTPELGDIEL